MVALETLLSGADSARSLVKVPIVPRKIFAVLQMFCIDRELVTTFLSGPPGNSDCL